MPIIEEMFAFVAEDTGPEDEGLVAEKIGGFWFPLVGADMARITSLRPMAERIAHHTGKKIKLIRFCVREEMEVIE